MHPRRKLLTRAVTSILASGLLLSASPAAADDCAGSPEAAACYLTAAHALKDSQPAEAARLYLASYRLDPKIDSLTGYGLSLALAEDHVAAADALEKASEDYEKLEAKFKEANTDASTMFAVVHRLELVRTELRRLAPLIGRVRLDVPDGKLPGGVTVVRKGGDDVRAADPTRLIVKPGGDLLVFTYPSGRTVERPVNVVGGLITTVDVPPEPPPLAAPTLDVPVADVDPGARLERYAYVSGGVGGGLLAFGFGYAVVADAPRFEITAALVGGGLVGIGAGAYLWYRAGKQRSASATALVPVIGDHMVGAVFAGSL